MFQKVSATVLIFCGVLLSTTSSFVLVQNSNIEVEANVFKSISSAFVDFFSRNARNTWTPDDCPPDDGQYGLVYNGGFEFGVPDNVSFPVSDLDADTICGWTRNFLGLDSTWEWVVWNVGARYFSSVQQQDTNPVILHEDIYMLANDDNNQRFVGLGVAEHTYPQQSHDYLMQQISGFIPNQQYLLTFDFSVEVNVSWPWPEQVDGVPSLGLAVLLLSDDQIENLSTSLWDSCCEYSGIYFNNELRDYATSQEFLETLQLLTQSEYIHAIYISETNEFSHTSEVGDIMQFEASFIAPDSEFDNLVIMPLGYDPEYVGATTWKAKSILAIDNVSIEEEVSSGQGCHIIYTGDEMIYAYYESGLTPITTGQSINMSQLQNYNPSVGAGVDTIIVAALGEGVLDIVSPGGAMLSQGQLDSLFDFSNIENNITFGSGGHHYLEYACSESCDLLPYDLNNDGSVDDEDFEIFITSFGSFCEDGCLSDFNQDGLVDILDLNALLEHMNTSCANTQSQNQYIQNSFVPGIELGNHVYNYSLKVEKEVVGQFTYTFPQSMIISSVLSTSRGNVLHNTDTGSIQINQRGTVPITVYLDIVLNESFCKEGVNEMLRDYKLCL